MRRPIEFTGDITDTIVTMSEGNPGGLNVLVQAVKKLDPVRNIAFLMHLEDMNIRGSQIWVGYKDCCDCDLDAFVEKVESRDSDMVSIINKEHSYDPENPLAVVEGGTN